MINNYMANNGLITKIWGPPLWTSLHCISFGYPIEPSDEHKKNYKDFFANLGNVLPCRYCRESYLEFIKEEGSILNDEVMENRETFTKWFYNLHNKVNKKLGMDYGITYEDVKKKYESYRAKCTPVVDSSIKGCIMPLDKKQHCYQEAAKKDCPIIDYDSGKMFKKLADMRKISSKNYYFWNIIENNNGNIKRDEIWDLRNKYCTKIVNYMREHSISSIEKSGKYQGLPTKLELRLMLALSTNLSKDEILEIVNKLKILFNPIKVDNNM